MRKIVLTAGAALALAACGKKGQAEAAEAAAQPVAEISVDAMSDAERKQHFAQEAASNLAASKAFLKENKDREGVKTTRSGLQYMVLEEGPTDGATPVSTDLVVVHYVGTLKDGIEFDSSRARGAAAQFRLNRVIPGWTEGLQLMSEGDRFRFFLPPDIAYGEAGSPPSIGPNEALIFDVELIKVQNPERNLAASKAFLAENGKKDGVKTTVSGLQYEVLSKGADDGKQPAPDSVVKVNFVSSLANGTELASTYETGQAATIPLSAVREPWVVPALTMMSVGDKYRFFIPPDLAYGELGTPGGPVGPNEALVYELELISVE